jgi:hypothetical protein
MSCANLCANYEFMLPKRLLSSKIHCFASIVRSLSMNKHFRHSNKCGFHHVYDLIVFVSTCLIAVYANQSHGNVKDASPLFTVSSIRLSSQLQQQQLHHQLQPLKPQLNPVITELNNKKDDMKAAELNSQLWMTSDNVASNCNGHDYEELPSSR